MPSRSFLSVCAVAGLLAATACESKSTTTGSTGSAKPAATTAAKATSGTSSADVSARPKPKARAKAALNEAKPVEQPGGKWVDIPDTIGTFQIPKDWKIIEGGPKGWALISSPKETSGLIATTYKKGDSSAAKLDQASTNLGFSKCDWQGTDDVIVGKDKLPAKVADGVCLQEDTGVYVIYLMAQSDDVNVFIMAGWDEDAPEEDIKKVIEIFSTIKKK